MDNILIPDDLKAIISKDSDIFEYLRQPERNIVEYWNKREDFRSGTSWHIPTKELVDSLVEYSPIVSVGSGFAYTESLAVKEGADIVATDLSPNKKNTWCRDGEFYCGVEKIKADEAVKKYKDRNVFMAWPPYDNPMAAEVANAMDTGKYLIFVGESYGGCTGDDNFFELLSEKFEVVNYDIPIPNWPGIRDECVIYKKIK
jgi:hypothetical protein